MLKKTFLLAFFFCIVNFFLFAFYRLFFLENFSHSINFPDILSILMLGMRLDFALLFFEIFLLVCIHLLGGKFRLRLSFLYLWTLTFFHALFSALNIAFFQERGQTLGDSFIAYITSPYEIYIAVAPFVKENAILLFIFFAASVLFFYIGFFIGKRHFCYSIPLWRSFKNIAIALFIGFLCFLPNIEAVTVKKNKSSRGWKWKITHSKYYAQTQNFIFNQAIPNPWYDFFRVHIPSLFTRSLPFQIEKEKSLQISLECLAISSENQRYPLLQKIQSNFSLGLENVVLIQVEGLSQILVDCEQEGKFIMPFVRKLSQEGIYFPHIFQSFNATTGAFFATATSFYKSFFEEKTRTFSTAELNGYYGTLGRLLGEKEYNHYFACGFRQNFDDFLAFMKNQGYFSYGYEDFQKQLQEKNPLNETEDLLGIFDGPFLLECAEILEKSPKKFTAHFITTTSHSPWAVPESFASPFKHPVFTAFYYVDKSIENFILKMKQNPERFARTLFVIVADHTSASSGEDFLERIRIPLIFYNPKLASFAGKENFQKLYGSQVDILPSLLDLLGGNRKYSGMGQSLFSKTAAKKGVLGGARDYGFYIKDNFLFQHLPWKKQTLLFKIQNNKISLKDISAEYPKIKDRMKLEYFSQSETSQRLILEKRTFPLEHRKKREK